MLSNIDECWFVFRLTLCSLVYNSLSTPWTAVDTLLEPMFWFVDHFMRFLGPVFVIVVILLTTSVVVITYICILPVKVASGLFWTLYHLVFGHWVLINIVFHYFKAAFTCPGFVPENISVVSSVCKKCIAPKPPRAHHCSVCDKCILKMDHHCPWLNNCVGHFNHRYFFMFCVYMWIGCLYVSLSGYPLYKEHFYGTNDGWSGILFPFELFTVFLNWCTSWFYSYPSNSGQQASVTSGPRDTNGFIFHHLIAFQFLLCSAACIALFALILWHARLIHHAETSIEVHTNKQEAERQKKLGVKYQNPYNFGGYQNWCNFLGLTHGRNFWRHILLPSAHPPDGSGLTWIMAYQKKTSDIV